MTRRRLLMGILVTALALILGYGTAYVASEDVRYFTGNTLFVDGGGHINGAAWAPELPDE